MTKQERQKVHDKYGGKCAYCGCELQKKWHADHCIPVHRIKKYVGGDYLNKETGEPATEMDLIEGNYKVTKRVLKPAGFLKPENDCFENMMPSCPSCNIYKHSADLETFRFILTNTINGLNKYNAQYKFAKRYGLITETNIDVKFYFETINNNLCQY